MLFRTKQEIYFGDRHGDRGILYDVSGQLYTGPVKDEVSLKLYIVAKIGPMISYLCYTQYDANRRTFWECTVTPKEF